MKIEHRFIKFLFVGGMNTLFGLLAYTVLVYLHLPIWAALIGANVAGVSFNYITTGRLVFSHRSTNRFPRFASIYLLCYLLNYLSVTVLIGMHFGPVVSQVLLTPFMAAVNYLLQARYVFGSDGAPSTAYQSRDTRD